MLSLIKRLFSSKEKKPTELYKTRVVEIEFGDGTKVYAPQMACARTGGVIKWGVILLRGTSFNSFSTGVYPHLINEYPKNTVEDKQLAFKIAKEFKEHLISNKIVSISEVSPSNTIDYYGV